MIWRPTLLGWACLFTVIASGLLLWVFKGEAFLSASHPLPPEVLVIEGWIEIEGVHAAKAEFDRGGYRLLITAGGPTDNRWGRQTWNHAVLAREELIRTGFSSDQVIAAPTQDSANHRTFASAVAVARILRSKNLHPTSLNIFTSGVHARRSRLVYAKVLTSRPALESLPGPRRYDSLALGGTQASEQATCSRKQSDGFTKSCLIQGAPPIPPTKDSQR